MTTLIAAVEAEVTAARDQVVPLVGRLDALRDLLLRAEYHRDQTGTEPTIDAMLAAADEVEAASLRSLAQRITEGGIR